VITLVGFVVVAFVIPCCLFPFPFRRRFRFRLDVEADAAVDGVVRGLSRRDVPEDAPLGTDNFVAKISIEASCGVGTVEDVEADAAVDWVTRCLTGRCGLAKDPLPRGADNGSSGRASYSTISYIPSLLGNKLTFRFHGGANASSATLR
jgi:hypothetical protein